MNPPKRVLISRVSSIGDVILSTPVLAAIKDTWPETEVDWIVGPAAADIVRMCRGVGRIYVHPDLHPAGYYLSRPAETASFLKWLGVTRKELQERQYDAAIDVQGLLKSALFVHFSRATTLVGWAPPGVREFTWMLTNHWVKKPSGGHVVPVWLKLAESIGADISNPRFPIEPAQEALQWGKDEIHRVGLTAPVIAVCIGTSRAFKVWPPERYAEIIRKANRKYGAGAILIWGNQDERKVAFETAGLCQGSAVVSEKTSLVNLAGLLASADLFLGGDTGPTHLAAALKTPVVAIYGATNPLIVGPYGQHCRVVNAFPGKPHELKIKRFDYTPMRNISVDDVWKVVSDALSELPEQESR